MIPDRMTAWAVSRGDRLAWGDVSLIETVRKEFEDLRNRGAFGGSRYLNNLLKFAYLEGVRLKEPRSVILIAVPRPVYLLNFSFQGKTIETVLPPTYVRYRPVFDEVLRDFRAALG